MSGLEPPRAASQDPGAHDLSDSSDTDHFSSASEGGLRSQRQSGSGPPVPQTRVERVDDKPAHGEVPGTPAYQKRTQDAVPDQIEVVPEGLASGSRSRATSNLSHTSASSVPRTVVERVDDKPAYGEVDGTHAKELRMADAAPDEVRQAPPEAQNGRPQGRRELAVDPEHQQAFFHNMWEGKLDPQVDNDEHADDEDEPGDDFDDFAEEGDDDDFGDFDEAEHAEENSPQLPAPSPAPDILKGLPPLDLSGLSPSEAEAAFQPYFEAIFPSLETDVDESRPVDAFKPSPFLSDRSLSLWQQLVSPPPMQPPDWTRSRIRRLFLVSLGVPVDLDEILPPSKQKRLVLPNINLSPTSPRPSTALDRLKGTTNNSSTSVDSKGNPKRPKGSRSTTATKGPVPPPDFDTNAASILCTTTPEAMSVYTDAELRGHIYTLESLNKKASTVLEYWLQRKDEGLKEKEALEGVIENLVGFVKGRRGK